MHKVVSDATTAGPYIVSDYEKITYYHGISPDPPELLYRSDLETNPFPVPKGRFPHLGVKTAHGVFNTPLNAVWHDVAPKIISLLKARDIRYSAVMAARFTTTLDETGKESDLSSIVLWIGTHPGTTTAKDAYDASPSILDLLASYQVKGATTEWYEGTVEKLAGRNLLRATDDSNPTYYVRRPFTALLGMPIAAKEMEADDAEGSVAFFFHENKTKSGDDSDRVLAVSTAHVLRKNPSRDYEFNGTDAARQMVRLAGMRRYQRALDETKDLIAENVTDASRFSAEIARLEAKPTSDDDEEEAADDARALKTKRDQLEKVNARNDELCKFFKTLDTQWHDFSSREIGYVDWAHKVDVDVAGSRFTIDLATFVLDAARFKAQFKGNLVDLGAKYTERELKNKFYPDHNTRKVFAYPPDRMLRIKGVVLPELLATPNSLDGNGEACLIVMKDGNSTDLTIGRYAGLHAYIADDLGVESVELAFYNYDERSGPFSAKGDSGSLVFDGEGRMVGVLHSGMLKGKGGSSHVTFATPAYFSLEQIKKQYPNADFDRESF